jgi:hypothetical protein
MLHKIPFMLAVFGMLGGVSIAILFGVNEDLIKDEIAAGLEQNTKLQSVSDPAEKEQMLEAEAEKNWRYYQRYHFHATGIGAMSLALLLFLVRVGAPEKFKLAASYLISVGGLLYPFVWLFAGMYGPVMGRSEAKEAFAVFGYMGGLFLVGVLLTLVLAMKFDIEGAESPTSSA